MNLTYHLWLVLFVKLNLLFVYSLLVFINLQFSSYLVGSNGLEPSTSRLSGVRSNHLSYEPIFLERFRRQSLLPLVSGGDEGDRTPDPLLARQVLSQLSYTPINKGFHLTSFDSSLFFQSKSSKLNNVILLVSVFCFHTFGRLLWYFVLLDF